MSGDALIFWISAAKPLIRSLARRNRLLVLSARTAAALVSTAGAPTRDSNANGFDGNHGKVDVGPGRRKEDLPVATARHISVNG